MLEEIKDWLVEDDDPGTKWFLIGAGGVIAMRVLLGFWDIVMMTWMGVCIR